MTHVVTIAGSPTPASRSALLLDYIRELLHAEHLTTTAIRVRDLNSEALFYGNVEEVSIHRAIADVSAARAVIIATPVYKAAYTGVLKAFLDTFSHRAFVDKIVLPIATGGSRAHLLTIDYALKPVLTALGAEHILSGLYIEDAQLQTSAGEVTWLDPDIARRLNQSLQTLVTYLKVLPFADLETAVAVPK